MATAAPLPAHPQDPRSYHPLEVIPYFRRFPCGPWRDALYTFIWNCGLGACLWLLGFLFSPATATFPRLLWNLLIANCIGYSIHLLFMLAGAAGADAWARRRGSLASTLYYTVLSSVGVLMGFGLVSLSLDHAFASWLRQPGAIVGIVVTSFVVSAIIAAIFIAQARSAEAEAGLERERARVERIERESALATLRALQAQIEPHFLFNTLANVSGLMDLEPAKAKRMLESFNRFLRASLAATRGQTTTLGEEAVLIAAYLDVLQVRMGERLRYRVDVPADLHGARIAPMLLQPVVENAIRHGLEPKVEGGEVRVVASAVDGGGFEVEVADTGVGFADTTRGGVGLTNLRDRLALLYGPAASLAISDAASGGSVVRVRIPA